MERCTGTLLESFLANYGWIFRSLGDNRWQSGFQGAERSFPLLITLGDTWISFQIEPYLGLDIDWDSWPEISKFLLELNRHGAMVRLSITEDGRIELGLDALISGFNYDSFTTCIGILAYYADKYYDEILNRFDSIGFRYSESLRLLT